MKLTKSDILSIPHVAAIGFDSLRKFAATGVSTDSRGIRPGDLFAALRGETFDGHNFVSSAVQAGAAALVVERSWAEANQPMLVSLYLPRLVVEDSAKALGDLARWWRRKFSIPVLAVAGSNGKTTTKEMIRTVLAAKYNVLATDGNLNNHLGVPQTLFRLDRKHDIAVVEIGTNHPGEIEYLCGVLEPTHGIITNIGREHLEFFGSIEGVAQAEGELFQWLAKHRGACFVNGDDRRVAGLARGMKHRTVYGFAARGAEVKGTGLSIGKFGCATLSVKPRKKKSFTIELTVPGRHNGNNALAAVTVGLAFKVPAVRIAAALNGFSAASKRMQIFTERGITVLNDTYNANPDSVLAALSTLRSLHVSGKRIAVLADMLELGPQAQEEHRMVGTAVAAYHVDVLFTFGSLAKYLSEAAVVDLKTHYEDKSLLSAALVQLAMPGDAVLVKGSRGMKMEEVAAQLKG